MVWVGVGMRLQCGLGRYGDETTVRLGRFGGQDYTPTCA